MKLIVGLGNPGKAYIDSRHNIGFLAINALSKRYGITLKRDFSTRSLSGKGNISGVEAILLKPLTFMNLSGIAVKALLKKYKVSIEDLLVICDDLDLELGRIKIRKSGSSGGHRGLASIMDSLGENNFNRLRIGIGRPCEGIEPAEYVLSPFTRKEKTTVNSVIKKACDCIEFWGSDGIVKTMNIFNGIGKFKKE